MGGSWVEMILSKEKHENQNPRGNELATVAHKASLHPSRRVPLNIIL